MTRALLVAEFSLEMVGVYPNDYPDESTAKIEVEANVVMVGISEIAFFKDYDADMYHISIEQRDNNTIAIYKINTDHSSMELVEEIQLSQGQVITYVKATFDIQNNKIDLLIRLNDGTTISRTISWVYPPDLAYLGVEFGITGKAMIIGYTLRRYDANGTLIREITPTLEDVYLTGGTVYDTDILNRVEPVDCCRLKILVEDELISWYNNGTNLIDLDKLIVFNIDTLYDDVISKGCEGEETLVNIPILGIETYGLEIDVDIANTYELVFSDIQIDREYETACSNCITGIGIDHDEKKLLVSYDFSSCLESTVEIIAKKQIGELPNATFQHIGSVLVECPSSGSVEIDISSVYHDPRIVIDLHNPDTNMSVNYVKYIDYTPVEETEGEETSGLMGYISSIVNSFISALTSVIQGISEALNNTVGLFVVSVITAEVLSMAWNIFKWRSYQ